MSLRKRSELGKILCLTSQDRTRLIVNLLEKAPSPSDLLVSKLCNLILHLGRQQNVRLSNCSISHSQFTFATTQQISFVVDTLVTYYRHGKDLKTQLVTLKAVSFVLLNNGSLYKNTKVCT